jgi:glucokinase
MSSIEDRVTPDTLAERRDAGVGLIGDIGATNARFALVFPGGKTATARVCALDDYASLADALAAYLAEQAPRPRARPKQCWRSLRPSPATRLR